MTTTPTEVTLRIVLVEPPPGIDYGIQHGAGSRYETRFTQRPARAGTEVAFEFTVAVKNDRPGGAPNFGGPFAQGKPDERFIYVDVGQAAGQIGAEYSRRMKVQLAGITWNLIARAAADGAPIETRIPGTGRDGGPTCASTAKAQSPWAVARPSPRTRRR
ncbi:MAG TPA: DUF5990 family protein [Vicinamibacterales bacterium]|nr:DUF5990 family protein [Vicinamibacterales bacterium]